MLISNTDALGIIFPNSYDSAVPELVTDRLMASIPFAGRYRMVDFILSSMAVCGIDNISIIVRKNYHSLMDHLGSGREWDLTRKNGGLNIVPPYAEKTVGRYNGRVEALSSILSFLREQKEKYVVMADANIAVNFDFKEMIRQHIASGADISIAYRKEVVPEAAAKPYDSSKDLYYTFDMDGNRVTKLYMNYKTEGEQNFSMNIYVMSRELLVDLVNTAAMRGAVFFERDIVAQQLEKLKICGYEFKGYLARITGMKSYFDENMKLLDENNLDALFTGRPIYTKIRDDNPTRYIVGAKAKNVMVADGCVIEGEVENCVLFRGVKIGKGAKVKNCVLMQDTVIGAGVSLEYVITDKDVVISESKEMKGTDTFPVYIAKAKRI